MITISLMFDLFYFSQLEAKAYQFLNTSQFVPQPGPFPPLVTGFLHAGEADVSTCGQIASRTDVLYLLGTHILLSSCTVVQNGRLTGPMLTTVSTVLLT